MIRQKNFLNFIGRQNLTSSWPRTSYKMLNCELYNQPHEASQPQRKMQGSPDFLHLQALWQPFLQPHLTNSLHTAFAGGNVTHLGS